MEHKIMIQMRDLAGMMGCVLELLGGETNNMKVKIDNL